MRHTFASVKHKSSTEEVIGCHTYLSILGGVGGAFINKLITLFFLFFLSCCFCFFLNNVEVINNMFNERFSIGETILENSPVPELKPEEIKAAIAYLNRKLEKDEVEIISLMLGLEKDLI